MAGDDLTLKLVMDAISNIGSKVDEGLRDMEKITAATEAASRRSEAAQRRAAEIKIARTGSLFDPRTWSVLMQNQEQFEQRMERLQRSGYDKIIAGGAILAPVVGSLKAAGDLEEVMNQIKVDVYDSRISTEEWERRTRMLRNTMSELKRDVRLATTDIGMGLDSLVRGNVTAEEVAAGAGRAAIYLAQASRGQLSTAETAEAVAKLGNAWQQTGKQMEETADMLSRVDAASTASIPDLIEGFKYVSSTASNLKLGVDQVAISLGVLNNAGIDASTAGTTLNMLLQNLQPNTDAAQEAFRALGLSVEHNPFYDVNGRLKPMLEIIQIIRRATKDMTDQQKQLAFRTIFDERGGRAVVALLKEGKNSYEDIGDSLKYQMSLWDRIKTQNQGMNAQLEIMKTNITNLFAESGSPVGQELTGFIKQLNAGITTLSEWTKANPEATSAVIKTTAAVGGLTLGVGALEIAIAKLAKVWKPLAPLLFSAEGLWVAGVAAAMYGANKASPWIPGTDAYSDRKVNEQYELMQRAEANKTALADRPAEFRPAPQPWYKRMFQSPANGFSGTMPGYKPAGQAVTVNIYPRDAREAAQEVKRVVNGVDVKYLQSRMPLTESEY